MEDSIFIAAMAAISSGEYCDSDIRTIKNRLNSLTKEELTIKRQMEKSKNDYSKQKDKTSNQLKTIRKDIKELQAMLKYV